MTVYNSSFNETLPFSDIGSKFNLAANVRLTFTVPGTNAITYRAKFSYTQNSNVWVSLNGTATVPVSGTQANSYMEEFRPDVKYVRGGDVLSIISGDAGGAQVGLSLLQLP